MESRALGAMESTGPSQNWEGRREMGTRKTGQRKGQGLSDWREQR